MRKLLTKRKTIILIVLVVLIGWWKINQVNNKATDDKAVKTATVTRGDVVSSIIVSGEISAGKVAVLNFPAPGKLDYIGVKEGDEAKKGHILATLDPGDLQTAWNRAYYAYIAADANAKQVEDSLKGHANDETFTQKTVRVAAQTARDTAYDTMLAAKRAINNSKLIAPFNGIVTGVTATAMGDTVSISDGVTIVDPNSLYFTGEVDESDVGRVSLGQFADITLDAYPGRKFEGNIMEIGYVAKLSATGATIFPIKIKLNDDVMSKLRIGMNGDADIILETKKNVLSLPIEAVVDGQVTLPGKEVKRIKVEQGLEGSFAVEIKSGLSEGDIVVIQ